MAWLVEDRRASQMAAGEPLGLLPYGTEAMHVLRAEKGFVIVGQETDGTVTPEMALVESSTILRKHFNPFVKYFELGQQMETSGVGAAGPACLNVGGASAAVRFAAAWA